MLNTWAIGTLEDTAQRGLLHAGTYLDLRECRCLNTRPYRSRDDAFDDRDPCDWPDG
jgi:hypothetical protein